MATLDDWRDDLAIEAPGASAKGMERALERAVTAFLQESYCYVVEARAITLRAGVSRYVVPRQSKGPVLAVLALRYKDDIWLKAQTLWGWARLGAMDDSEPVYYRGNSEDTSVFEIKPAPLTVTSDSKVTPFVAIGYDSECADGIPNILKERWYEAILSGALSLLCSQQDKPYSNILLAQVHHRAFRDGIAASREMMRKHFVTQDEAVPFPKWA